MTKNYSKTIVNQILGKIVGNCLKKVSDRSQIFVTIIQCKINTINKCKNMREEL